MPANATDDRQRAIETLDNLRLPEHETGDFVSMSGEAIDAYNRILSAVAEIIGSANRNDDGSIICKWTAAQMRQHIADRLAEAVMPKGESK